MLDQLVESKSNLAALMVLIWLFAVISVIMVLLLLFGWGYSLFGKDYGLGGGDLELSTLVAPPPPDEEPPPKEEKKPEEKKDPAVDLRKELIQNIFQTPVKPPDTTSVTKNTIPPMRLDRMTKIGDSNSDNPNAIVDRGGGAVPGTASSFGSNPDTSGDSGNDVAVVPPPKPTPKPAPKTISGGVLNGKAISLPKPAYPAAARAVRASGQVTVQVLIDEEGRVVSASAGGGHPLLVPAALAAARGARFSPTLLSGQPVKVSGVITYNFVP